MSGKTPITKDILDSMARHESAISELYAACAKRFKDYHGFWTRLAEDEARHAFVLVSAKTSLKDSSSADNPYLTLAESSTKFVRRQLDGLNTNPDTPLGRMLSLALKIEDSFFENSSFDVFSDAPEEVKKAGETLCADTKVHSKLISELIEKLAKSEH